MKYRYCNKLHLWTFYANKSIIRYISINMWKSQTYIGDLVHACVKLEGFNFEI